eukprot:Nk52_evm6s378 gene=Nk52_evmTU6s378
MGEFLNRLGFHFNSSLSSRSAFKAALTAALLGIPAIVPVEIEGAYLGSVLAAIFGMGCPSIGGQILKLIKLGVGMNLGVACSFVCFVICENPIWLLFAFFTQCFVVTVLKTKWDMLPRIHGFRLGSILAYLNIRDCQLGYLKNLWLVEELCSSQSRSDHILAILLMTVSFSAVVCIGFGIQMVISILIWPHWSFANVVKSVKNGYRATRPVVHNFGKLYLQSDANMSFALAKEAGEAAIVFKKGLKKIPELEKECIIRRSLKKECEIARICGEAGYALNRHIAAVCELWGTENGNEKLEGISGSIESFFRVADHCFQCCEEIFGSLDEKCSKEKAEKVERLKEDLVKLSDECRDIVDTIIGERKAIMLNDFHASTDFNVDASNITESLHRTFYLFTYSIISISDSFSTVATCLLGERKKQDAINNNEDQTLVVFVKSYIYFQLGNGLQGRIKMALRTAVQLALGMLLYFVTPQGGVEWMSTLHTGAYYPALFSISSLNSVPFQTVEASIKKGLMRGAGVIFGGVMCLLVLVTLADNKSGVILATFLNVFGAMYTCDHTDYSYAPRYWAQTFTSVGIKYYPSYTSYDVEIVSLKVLMVLIGISLALLFIITVFPRRAGELAINEIRDMMVSLGQLLLVSIDATIKPKSKEDQFKIIHNIQELQTSSEHVNALLGQVPTGRRLFQNSNLDVDHCKKINLELGLSVQEVGLLSDALLGFPGSERIQSLYIKELEDDLVQFGILFNQFIHSLSAEIEENACIPADAGYSLILEEKSQTLFLHYRKLRVDHRNILRNRSQSVHKTSVATIKQALFDDIQALIHFNIVLIAIINLTQRMKSLEELAKRR